MHNWQSLYSVASALQSPPIARLKKTWDALIRGYPDHFSEFIALTETLKEKHDIHPADEQAKGAKLIWSDRNGSQSSSDDDAIELASSQEHGIGSIPFFDDMIGNIKERCARKLEELRCLEAEARTRRRCHWAEPGSLASWVMNEVQDVERRAMLQKQMKQKEKKSLSKALSSSMATFSSSNTNLASHQPASRLLSKLRRPKTGDGMKKSLTTVSLATAGCMAASSAGLRLSAPPQPAAPSLASPDSRSPPQSPTSPQQPDPLRRVFSVPGDMQHATKSMGQPTASSAINKAKTPTSPAPKISWSAVGLREDQEKEVFKEIQRTLAEYHQDAQRYTMFNKHNERIRDFILLHPYDSMNKNINKSFILEPKSSPTTPQRTSAAGPSASQEPTPLASPISDVVDGGLQAIIIDLPSSSSPAKLLSN